MNRTHLQPNKAPRLSVVGAGPGDPELITIKAIKTLKTADVILYDALINPDLLKYVPNHCETIFVGKRKGCYAYQQDQINELIVQRAKQYGHVVRLKGGDSFVFGRGAEELDYARQFGLQTAVIPGISSAAAVPAYQGIPLTRRGAAQGFWVITGTTRHHQLSNDLKLAAKSSSTVVILMGMAKLKDIVKVFKEEDRANYPIAIIQNGTTKDEKVAFGTINTIVKQVENQGLSSPAIIIIGEVVKQKVKLTKVYNEVLYQNA